MKVIVADRILIVILPDLLRQLLNWFWQSSELKLKTKYTSKNDQIKGTIKNDKGQISPSLLLLIMLRNSIKNDKQGVLQFLDS